MNEEWGMRNEWWINDGWINDGWMNEWMNDE